MDLFFPTLICWSQSPNCHCNPQNHSVYHSEDICSATILKAI